MNKRVVITGLGVLAGNGKGKTEYWQALKDGRPGCRPITLFDTAEFQVHQAGEVPDFDPKEYFGPKGMRTMDRSSKLLVSASKLAIADSGFEITEDNTDDTGVSVGCTLGSLQSIHDFDMTTLRDGPRYTNPALFPNTVINAPASQVSIWNNIQGFNTTISTGFTASLDAIQYAYDFIQLERAKYILAGGIEELCYPTFYGFHALKFLSGSRDQEPYLNCPFDRRRNGVTFGEGACLIVMEELEHARARSAKIIGEIFGFGYYFDTFRANKYNPKGTGMKEAMRQALEDAHCAPEDIGYICANANSTQAADRIECAAIKDVFGSAVKNIPVSAVKSMVGECYSVGAALAAAAALGVLEENFLPPTIGYEQPDPDCDLDVVANQSRPATVDRILVNAFGPGGNNASMIMGRYVP